MVVALYGLCVLAPAAVFAFGDGPSLITCLTDDHHYVTPQHSHRAHAAQMHVHQDGAIHHHGDDEGDDAKARHSGCCELACLSALPAALGVLISAPVLQARLVLQNEQPITGRDPDLLYRPPVLLASL